MQNPAGTARALESNPVSTVGVIADVASWILGGLAAEAVAARVSTTGVTQQMHDGNISKVVR